MLTHTKTLLASERQIKMHQENMMVATFFFCDVQSVCSHLQSELLKYMIRIVTQKKTDASNRFHLDQVRHTKKPHESRQFSIGQRQTTL